MIINDMNGNEEKKNDGGSYVQRAKELAETFAVILRQMSSRSFWTESRRQGRFLTSRLKRSGARYPRCR